MAASMRPNVRLATCEACALLREQVSCAGIDATGRPRPAAACPHPTAMRCVALDVQPHFN